MQHQSILTALAGQLECYRRLFKLAALQHEHVQQGQTQELLDVLKTRQEVLDRAAVFEGVIAPIKRIWSSFLEGLDPADRALAESLLAESRQLLEQITSADRNDAMVLQQRKLNLGREISRAGAARQVNRTYAASAYGARPTQMDIQR